MKNLRFGLAVFASVLATTTFSEAGNGMSATAYSTSEFVNFAGTGPAGIPSDTLPGGLKFLSLTIRNGKNARSFDTDFCVEITTAQAGISTMDTRIWMRNANGSLVSLSDDDGSSKFSRLMVYVDRTYTTSDPGIGNTIELLIAAKSTLHNSGNFHVVKTGGLEWGVCEYSNGPYVYVDQYGAQLFRTQ